MPEKSGNVLTVKGQGFVAEVGGPVLNVAVPLAMIALVMRMLRVRLAVVSVTFG